MKSDKSQHPAFSTRSHVHGLPSVSSIFRRLCARISSRQALVDFVSHAFVTCRCNAHLVLGRKRNFWTIISRLWRYLASPVTSPSFPGNRVLEVSDSNIFRKISCLFKITMMHARSSRCSFVMLPIIDLSSHNASNFSFCRLISSWCVMLVTLNSHSTQVMT